MPHAYPFGKNLGKSGTERTERNGQADFAHSNVKGASAKIFMVNLEKGSVLVPCFTEVFPPIVSFELRHD